MRDNITISPVDVTKEIHAHMDAAQKTSMSYLLCQPRSNNPADEKNSSHATVLPSLKPRKDTVCSNVRLCVQFGFAGVRTFSR